MQRSSATPLRGTREAWEFMKALTSEVRKMFGALCNEEYKLGITAPLEQEQKANASQTVTLNTEGVVAWIYYQMFKERIPSSPNANEIERIRVIYEFLKKPSPY